MAQDVQKIIPEAVITTNCHLAVNYGLIGIEFRRIA